MPKKHKPGEIADRSGEYEERGSQGGEIRNPREVSIDRGDKMPPTRQPNRTWRRIGPKKP